MKKLWLLLIMFFCALAALAIIGGSFSTVNRNRRHPTSAVNKTILPTRIVSLAPDFTEIVFALGLGEKVIAVSSDSDYPASTADKIKTGTFWNPNIEAVLTARPDLVIALWFEQQRAVAESLSRMGYRVLILRLEKIQQLLSAIEQTGAATGTCARAGELTDNLRTKLNNIGSRYKSTERVRVLWVIQAEPLRVAGRDTFINEMIELAGGENAIGSTIHQYPPISTEELLGCGAEVIIQSAVSETDLSRQQKAAQAFWSRYAALPAVKNNRIYVVEPDIVLRLGPRLPEGIELIAGYLHPDENKGTETSERKCDKKCDRP